MLGTLSVDYLNRLVPHSINLFLGLHSLLLDLLVHQAYFFNVNFVLQSEKLLHVVSFKLEDVFVLRVYKSQVVKLMLLDLHLKMHIKTSGHHKCNSQISRNNNVHDVNLLDNDSIAYESLLEVGAELHSQLRFDVPDPCYLDFFDEVSNALIALLLQKFLQSVRAKIVKKSSGIFLLSLMGSIMAANMEVDANIQ